MSARTRGQRRRRVTFIVPAIAGQSSSIRSGTEHVAPTELNRQRYADAINISLLPELHGKDPHLRAGRKRVHQ